MLRERTTVQTDRKQSKRPGSAEVNPRCPLKWCAHPRLTSPAARSGAGLGSNGRHQRGSPAKAAGSRGENDLRLRYRNLISGGAVAGLGGAWWPGGAVGRSKGDAPEIDGKVHLQHRFPVRVGDIVTARITGADAYDLHGTVV